MEVRGAVDIEGDRDAGQEPVTRIMSHNKWKMKTKTRTTGSKTEELCAAEIRIYLRSMLYAGSATKIPKGL